MRKRSKRTGRFLKGGGTRRRSTKRRRRRNPEGVTTNPPAKRNMPRTAANPHRAANPRRRRARRAARGTMRFFGISIPPINTLVAGVVGMAAVRAVPGLIASRLPMLPTVGPAGIAVRAAVALFGGRLVAATAGASAGKNFTLGGLLSVADELSRVYILPNIGLGAYLQPAYDGDAVGAYLTPGAGELGDTWGATLGPMAAAAAGGNITPGRSVTPSRLDPANRFTA